MSYIIERGSNGSYGPKKFISAANGHLFSRFSPEPSIITNHDTAVQIAEETKKQMAASGYDHLQIVEKSFDDEDYDLTAESTCNAPISIVDITNHEGVVIKTLRR